MIHRMIHKALNITVAATYLPYQDLENKVLLTNLLDTPDDLLPHIRRASYSLSTQMIFGFRCISNQDPKLLQLFHVYRIPSGQALMLTHRRALINGAPCLEAPAPSWPISIPLSRSSLISSLPTSDMQESCTRPRRRCTLVTGRGQSRRSWTVVDSYVHRHSHSLGVFLANHVPLSAMLLQRHLPRSVDRGILR